MRYLSTKNVLCILFLFFSVAVYAQKEKKLRELLGIMPSKPKMNIDTLEKKRIENGWRYRIKFLAEDSNSIFHSPPDYMYAFVFVPDLIRHKKLPGMLAIHQDGNHNYLGYLETAGIAGDKDQHYGLELYRRGYVVICPNRFLHAERRRISRPDTLADVFEVADIAEQHWVGQLQLTGRNFVGKEVYDLMLATDVLLQTANIDKDKIGAIGHSAGGYILAYFMFADKRIKAGASSCGVFELVDWFAEDAIRKRNVLSVIPGLARVGRTSDFIGFIAPRPFLMTRGMNEWGSENPQQKTDSRRHVEGTTLLDKEAREYYQKLKAGNRLKTIYFDEDGGGHSFPAMVKEQVYNWLDSYLKN